MVILFLAWLTEDQCKTEEELPPLMLGDDFKCKNFYPDKNKYFHLHGGKLYANNAKNSHDAILIWMGTGHSGCCLWYLSTIKYIWKLDQFKILHIISNLTSIYFARYIFVKNWYTCSKFNGDESVWIHEFF